MAEHWFNNLSLDDKSAAFQIVEQSSSYETHLLEKDVWVVTALGILF